MKPLISVLMPVYNTSEFISEAISSILNQTLADFELIIIDDASTDNTIDKIMEFKDDRINLIQKEKNTGYTNSLNIGLKIAKGEFIARMDGDDISVCDRFEKQIKYLKEHLSVVVCGTNYQFLDSGKINLHPEHPDKLKVYLLSGCYVAHPTVMMRRSLLIENNIFYDPYCEPAEDFNLWVLLSNHGDIGNLGEPLLKYRVHQKQTSSLHFEKQVKFANQARIEMLTNLFPKNELNKRVKEIHLALMTGNAKRDISNRDVTNWIHQLTDRNKITPVFHSKELYDFLSQKQIEYAIDRKKIKSKNILKRSTNFFKIKVAELL
jgi:glycosyltransferase involved in cell wall biosynthesis